MGNALSYVLDALQDSNRYAFPNGSALLWIQKPEGLCPSFSRFAYAKPDAFEVYDLEDTHWCDFKGNIKGQISRLVNDAYCSLLLPVFIILGFVLSGIHLYWCIPVGVFLTFLCRVGIWYWNDGCDELIDEECCNLSDLLRTKGMPVLIEYRTRWTGVFRPPHALPMRCIIVIPRRPSPENSPKRSKGEPDSETIWSNSDEQSFGRKASRESECSFGRMGSRRSNRSQASLRRSSRELLYRMANVESFQTNGPRKLSASSQSTLPTTPGELPGEIRSPRPPTEPPPPDVPPDANTPGSIPTRDSAVTVISLGMEETSGKPENGEPANGIEKPERSKERKKSYIFGNERPSVTGFSDDKERCPWNHPLFPHDADPRKGCLCDICNTDVGPAGGLLSCRQCGWDICPACNAKPRQMDIEMAACTQVPLSVPACCEEVPSELT